MNSSDLRMKIFHLATSLRACNIFHIIHYLENNDITPLLSPESLEISPSHCGVYPSHHLSPLASEGKELAAQASREGFDFSLQDSGHWVESRPPPPTKICPPLPPCLLCPNALQMPPNRNHKQKAKNSRLHSHCCVVDLPGETIVCHAGNNVSVCSNLS